MTLFVPYCFFFLFFSVSSFLVVVSFKCVVMLFVSFQSVLFYYYVFLLLLWFYFILFYRLANAHGFDVTLLCTKWARVCVYFVCLLRSIECYAVFMMCLLSHQIPFSLCAVVVVIFQNRDLWSESHSKSVTIFSIHSVYRFVSNRFCCCCCWWCDFSSVGRLLSLLLF